MTKLKEITTESSGIESQQVDETLMLKYMESCNIANQLSANEKIQFVSIAKAYQLNPFKREIYCIAYGKDERRKLNIITGYEVYLKRAERTNKLAGWKVTCTGSGAEMRATIEIHRKDWNMPLVHEVSFKEYNQNSPIWQSKPETMLKKVAMAQGFRLAFPDELGGIPYDSSEIPEGQEIKFVNAKEVNKVAPEVTKEIPMPPVLKAEQANTGNPGLESIFSAMIDACKSSTSLKEVSEQLKANKDKFSDEERSRLRSLFEDQQDKLMGC